MPRSRSRKRIASSRGRSRSRRPIKRSMSRSRSVSSIRFPSYSRYGSRSRSRARSATGSKTFAAKVKAIVLRTAETKRRGVVAPLGNGTDMTLTATANSFEGTNVGLWLNSTAASTDLGRPDTALNHPPNAVFGAIAKGDDSVEREGDNVLLSYMSNKHVIRIGWGIQDSTSQDFQRAYCLEFLLCIKDPIAAAKMTIDMDTSGDDYSDLVMRVLMANGAFSAQYTNAVIVGNTPQENTTANQSVWHRSVVSSTIKEWTRDYTKLEVEERRDGKALGSIIWKRQRVFKRPAGKANSTHVRSFISAEASADITGNLGATATIAAHDHTSAEHNVDQGFQTSLHRMGFRMHLKKPIKLVYNIDTDGSETTTSLPVNKMFVYGTLWQHNLGPGGAVKYFSGGAEMRWKDP